MAKLNISDNFIAIVSHQEFFVFSLDSRKLTWNFVKAVKCTENVPKSEGSIECCAFSSCEKYFGICFDKNFIIYRTSDWCTCLICSAERRASSLQFFPVSNVVLIADKSGSATFYVLKENEVQKSKLAFGHNSMLTCALISNDEKFIITSDRDEKIRVTNYPNIYNIETFCLGHDMFVSCIGFLPTDKRILISCSGDGTVRFWNFVQGKQVALYDVNESKNFKNTLIKFVSSRVNQMSLVAILEYKSTEIRILSIKGDLNSSLNIELIKVLKLKCIPWDISFYKNILMCLLPDAQNPITCWSLNEAESDKYSKSIALYLSETWDSFMSTSNKITDDVLVLFKREVDNLQEYQQRKKARLLKTGKTS